MYERKSTVGQQGAVTGGNAQGAGDPSAGRSVFPAGSRLRRAVSAILWSFGTLVWILFFVPFHSQPGELPDLGRLRPDQSYQLIQVELFAQGRQYGPEIIWTYGPLGFVLNDPLYLRPDRYPAILFIRLLMALTLLGALWLLVSRGCLKSCGRSQGCALDGARGGAACRGLNWWTLFTTSLWMIALWTVFASDQATLTSAYWLAFPLVAVWLAGVGAVRRDDAAGGSRTDWPWGLAVSLLAVCSAVSAEIKFTHLMFGGVCYTLLAGLDLSRGHWPKQSLFWGGCVLLLWVLCGQSLANLPGYLISHLRLTGGYAAAMAKGFSQPYLLSDGVLFVLAEIAPLVGLIWLLVRFRRREAVCLVLAAAAYLFLANSHAWGGNQLESSARCLILLNLLWLRWLTSELPIDTHRRAIQVLGGLSAVAILSCGVLIGRYDPVSLNLQASGLSSLQQFAGERWRGLCAAVRGDLSQQAEAHHKLLARIRELCDWPADLRGTVDFLGDNGGLLAAYPEYHYQPRPMFLSLNAHNEWLAQQNAEYYTNGQAPDWVFAEMVWFPISPYDRWPALSDGPAQRQLFQHYDLVRVLREHLLFRKRSAPRELQVELVADRPIRWGEVVELPDAGADQLWARCRIEPTQTGRLTETVYKLPRIRLRTELNDGTQRDDVLVPRMAAAGFLLSPVCTSNHELAAIAGAAAGSPGGADLRRVVRFSLHVEEGRSEFFQPTVSLQLERVRYAGGGATDVVPEVQRLLSLNWLRGHVKQALFPAVMETITLRTRTDAHAERQIERPVSVLFVHAPSRIELPLPVKTKTVRIGFALKNSAWAGTEGRTAGAEFRISLQRQGQQTTELFARQLRPAEAEADRGEQTALIRIPESGATQTELPQTKRNVATQTDGVSPTDATDVLILETLPGADGVAFDHTCWTGLWCDEE